MNIELRKLSDIRPYENNSRLNDAAVEAVAASIREFGFRQPIVVDEQGIIVVGHTRYQLLDAWFGNVARVLLPGHGFFVWGGYANLGNYPPFLKKHGLYFSQGIVWDKEHPVLTRKDFMGAFEIAFYGWREGAAHRYFGPNNTGQFLWGSGNGGCHSRFPFSYTKPNLHTCDEYCEWGKAAEAARIAGHTEYHVGLRPFAMAIWLRWKPGMLEHRRTRGNWIYDEPPTRLETMTSEERKALSADDLIRLFREMNQRKGHWSKSAD